MEGKAESHDLNSSLETEDSDEVWFCVILEGREGSVSGMGGGGWRDPKAAHPPDRQSDQGPRPLKLSQRNTHWGVKLPQIPCHSDRALRTTHSWAKNPERLPLDIWMLPWLRL